MRNPLQTADGWLRLAIETGNLEDDGPGVPPENRERTFEHGFSTKENTNGSRIGMTSVRQLVLAHDWRIGPGEAQTLGGVRFDIRT